MQLLRVGKDRRQACGYVCQKCELTALCLRAQALDSRIKNLRDADWHQSNGYLPRLCTRELEQRLNHQSQVLNLHVHSLDKVGSRRRILDGATAQGIDNGAQRRQGSPKFVRNVADKIAPHGLKAPYLTQILQHDQASRLILPG